LGGVEEGTCETLAAALPPLTPQALELLARRRPNPLELYLVLKADSAAFDVSSLEGAIFQRRFNGFYGVRRNAAWRSQFYALFQAAKDWGDDPATVFRQALEALHARTGRVEASFVSKLVATLHPSAPVIDKLIRDFLAARVAAPPFGGGLAEATAYYDWLSAVMTALSRTPEARAWSDTFDVASAGVAGAAAIDPVKKLDFLIWAGSRA
jgi:hypothetical protein